MTAPMGVRVGAALLMALMLVTHPGCSREPVVGDMVVFPEASFGAMTSGDAAALQQILDQRDEARRKSDGELAEFLGIMLGGLEEEGAVTSIEAGVRGEVIAEVVREEVRYLQVRLDGVEVWVQAGVVRGG